jgi:hypothetical protein
MTMKAKSLDQRIQALVDYPVRADNRQALIDHQLKLYRSLPQRASA